MTEQGRIQELQLHQLFSVDKAWPTYCMITAFTWKNVRVSHFDHGMLKLGH
jgi:hypothetical protein